MRNIVWAFGLLLLWLGGCEEQAEAPTDVYVSFKTDLAIGSQVSAVRVRVFRSTDDPDSATPLSEHTVSAENLSKKLPLVLEKGDANEFLLEAQAVGPGDDPQVARHVKARFQDGQKLSLQVFLGRSCARKTCSQAGDTCFGEAHGAACEGSCGPIDAAETLPVWSQARTDWQPETCAVITTPHDGGTDSGSLVLVAGGLDAGQCAPSVPGAACDPVKQCGCASDKGCGLLAIQGTTAQLGCTERGTLPSGSACSADSCVAGNTCVGSLCRPFCNRNTDCGAHGHCVGAVTDDAHAQPIAGLSACFAGCAIDSDCATGCCRPLASAPHAGNLCLHADACCTQAGAACTSNADCCGFSAGEAVCVTEPGAGAICRATCSTSADCQSGCCADLTGVGKACFAQDKCQQDCAAANQPCQTNADCCGGTNAVCVDQGQGPICADRCAKGSQCRSGCCAPLQVGGSVCAPQLLFCP